MIDEEIRRPAHVQSVAGEFQTSRKTSQKKLQHGKYLTRASLYFSTVVIRFYLSVFYSELGRFNALLCFKLYNMTYDWAGKKLRNEMADRDIFVLYTTK